MLRHSMIYATQLLLVCLNSIFRRHSVKLWCFSPTMCQIPVYLSRLCQIVNKFIHQNLTLSFFH